MLAISIRQPWAWLIIRPDIVDEAARLAALGLEIKDIENRDWATKVRGRVLIHAAKGMTQSEWNDGWHALADAAGEEAAKKLPRPEAMPRGGIVGSAEIMGCFDNSLSPWFQGRFGFGLRDSRPLPFVPLRGMLGFFNVPDTLIGAPDHG